MTIRLFDSEDQARYEAAVDKYEELSRKMQGDPTNMGPWPAYPKPPEPFIDSRDPNAVASRNLDMQPLSIGASTSYMATVNKIVDFDGNSQQEVEGYESNWTKGTAAPTTPFSVKGK